MKTADSPDNFGVQIKIVIQKVLKLWPFEVAKRNSSHFEKMTERFCVIWHIFFSNGGSESAKLGDFFHGNTLAMLAYAEAAFFFFFFLNWFLCVES